VFDGGGGNPPCVLSMALSGGSRSPLPDDTEVADNGLIGAGAPYGCPCMTAGGNAAGGAPADVR
jgi:hypothetical protein